MHARVIGVDAGGTKTLGLLVDGEGGVLRRAQSGGSNIRAVGMATAERNLKEVLTALLRDSPVLVVCIGAAGTGRENDRRDFMTLARRHVPAGVKLDVRTDAQIVLRAATPSRPAIAVIAGTGSLVYGETADQTFRAGGYGAVIGDPGSGYAIGIAALRHTTEALDAKLAHESALAQAVMQMLNASSVDEIIERVHRWPPDVAAIAAISKHVGRLCEGGDLVAQRIVEDAGAALGRLVILVAKNVRTPARLPIVLSGGAFDAIPALLEGVQKRALETGPCEFIRLDKEPAWGAAQAALDLLPDRA